MIKPHLATLPEGRKISQIDMLLATWFGSGLLRPAPGTFGSLAALHFGFAIAYFTGPVGLLLAALALYFIGAWAAGRYCKATGKHDDQSIVIDEVVGLWIAAIPATTHWPLWLWAFLLFRFFDIVKPWPASFFDKKAAGGHNVILDDVIAGIYAMLGVGVMASLFLES